MRSLILLTLILGLRIAALGQTTLIKGKNFEGVAFDSSFLIFKNVEEEKSRYTLTRNEIEKGEKILSEKLASLNQKQPNQGAGCPIIHKHLKKYYRQYVGFENTKGEIIIWINCFWDKNLIPSAKNEIRSAYDGCSYYWNIEVNITTSELKNLDVNGRG